MLMNVSRLQVTDDHTIEERELIKECVVKARGSNEKEGEHSQVVYNIRGSPKKTVCAW